MEVQNLFQYYIDRCANDGRITVWHLAVICSILQLSSGKSKGVISISRKKVMQLAHINSIVTYHKCIKELQQFGYIHYRPSYHPAFGSEVRLL